MPSAVSPRRLPNVPARSTRRLPRSLVLLLRTAWCLPFAVFAQAQEPPAGVPYYPPGRTPQNPPDEIVLPPVFEGPNAGNGYVGREIFVVPAPIPAPDPQAVAEFRVATCWAEALNRFHAGEYAESMRQIRAVRLEKPDFPEAPLLAAQASFALGNYRSAVDELRRGAVRRSVEWTAVASRWKTLYGRPVDFADQIYALTRQVRKESSKPGDAHLLLAFQFRATGHLLEAEQLLGRVRSVSPDDPVVERLAADLKSLRENPPPQESTEQEPAQRRPTRPVPPPPVPEEVPAPPAVPAPIGIES